MVDGAAMNLPPPECLFFVCGPTASGKSEFALEVAEKLDGEIVNADAFQLYRGLETLTAAPGPEDRARIPHHLYGVLQPESGIDAMGYVRRAVPVIEELISRGKTPVITGGSGLYLKFLSHGASPLPAGDPELRALLEATPLEDLVARLREIDPVEAARTDPNNRRYVSRALEICLLSGAKCSDLRDDWDRATALRASKLRGVLLRRNRGELHRRIALRTRAMLDGGAITEVEALGEVAPNVAKAIGFGEIRELLAGIIDRAECEERINAATRQYAKRQETWFRRESWLEVVPR